MKHWTENDFKQWLYGLKEPDSHLEACPDCRTEVERLRVARQRALAEPEVSTEFLSEQRRSIYNRMLHPGRNFVPLRWALSIAMLLVVAIGLTLPRAKKATVALTNDEQLYSDLTRIEQTEEPQAIQPLHNLFEQ
jgi:hypothetical protein